MNDKYSSLCALLKESPRFAIAYSGGADSTLLMYAAAACGAEARAYYVKSAFQPAWECEDAKRFAEGAGMPLSLLSLEMTEYPQIMQNDAQRCYHCKRAIIGRIWAQAKADGCLRLMDGTNASDEAGDRPGMRALEELSVLSPLRVCGIGKAEVYALSEQLGLPSAHKPAYACLATRIPTGRAIDGAMLSRVEAAENALFRQGFTDFRVRVRGEGALLQLRAEEQARYLSRKYEYEELLRPWFSPIELDAQARKGG